MKDPLPYLCDECKSRKQPTNGWSIGMIGVKADAGDARVAIFEWNEELAEVEGVAHLCGPQCVSTFTAKAMMKQ